MKNILLVLLLIISLYSQAQIDSTKRDSAIIILKNVSTQKINSILMVVNSKIIGTGTLNPGDSSVFKVPVSEKKENGRCVITAENSTTTIQPMDYPDQVTSEIIEKGTYLFLVNIGPLNTGEPGEYAKFEVKKIK